MGLSVAIFKALPASRSIGRSRSNRMEQPLSRSGCTTGRSRSRNTKSRQLGRAGTGRLCTTAARGGCGGPPHAGPCHPGIFADLTGQAELHLYGHQQNRGAHLPVVRKTLARVKGEPRSRGPEANRLQVLAAWAKADEAGRLHPHLSTSYMKPLTK